MSNKVKMSNRKFRCITLPIAAFLLIIAIVLIIAANIFAPYMDYRFGRGQSHIVGGGTDLSAEYYTAKYDTPEEAKEAFIAEFGSLARALNPASQAYMGFRFRQKTSHFLHHRLP